MSKRGYAASKKLLTGLIGAPIAHSASPAMHERAAEALGLRGHYQLIEVAGADAAGLRMMLEGVRRLGFAGVNDADGPTGGRVKRTATPGTGMPAASLTSTSRG